MLSPLLIKRKSVKDLAEGFMSWMAEDAHSGGELCGTLDEYLNEVNAYPNTTEYDNNVLFSRVEDEVLRMQGHNI